MLGFFSVFASRNLFGGPLSDPNGIPPARIVVFRSEKWIDLNQVVEIFAITLPLGFGALFQY
jgi:hypothetical protein